jgi:membrane associated rhomboid family serine protease
MLRLTDVVKNLLILNILMFIGTMWMGEPTGKTLQQLVGENSTNISEWGRLRFALFFPSSPFFQPYQIVTHMFMHGDITHLFFNMFAVFMFGPPLENLWGPKRFLFFYLITGFGAMLLHILVQYIEMSYLGGPGYLVNVPMLGASGAVFGLLAGYGLMFPESRIMLLFPPIPMKAKLFVLIYAGIELFLGLSRFNTGIAHFAHLGGALFGLILILYWRKYGSRF